jgi:DNA-directed RNA polymerase specialized sigma24 family protein
MLIPSQQWLRITHHRAWIRRVALRKYTRPAGSRRSPAATPLGELPELPDLDMDHAGVTDETVTVLAAIRILDEDLRAVIAMDWDDISTHEIAQYLGVTPQKVRDLRKKAREQLHRALKQASAREEQ